MKVSLSGILLRMKGRSDLKYMVEQFLKHFKQAKEAHENDNNDVLTDFFETYVVEHTEFK